MIVSMQGNWSIGVKTKQASYPQRFIVSGATTGNGAYDANTDMSPVIVKGDQWSISIEHNPGSGFQLSDTRIKFPRKIGNDYVFDVESNDSGGDNDFNDLILECKSTALINDYMIYGNVTLYSGLCLINPCFRRWFVIDTHEQLLEALKVDRIRDIIKKYYPERIPEEVINPPFPPIPQPGPDPIPGFKPIMINVVDEAQIPIQEVNIYRRIPQTTEIAKAKKDTNNSDLLLSNYKVESSMLKASTSLSSLQTIDISDRLELAKSIDFSRFRCDTEVGANLTLSFEEYDRTTSELAGGSYTGDGHRKKLGDAITDMHGNYLFKFKHGFWDKLKDIFQDTAPGETYATQLRPDIIVKVQDTFNPSKTVFETAPRFNVQNLQRINLCLPKSKIETTGPLCFNGNLVGSLGNVFIGGNQNTLAQTNPNILKREGYSNHLHADGKITVKNSQAGFSVDCASWAGTVDFHGCMYNAEREENDPIIRHYTIRYRKPGNPWQFVKQVYRHPQFSKRSLPNYHGDLVGPFATMLNVDGGVSIEVPAYKCIQTEAFLGDASGNRIDWEFSRLDRYIRLNTNIYDEDTPGTVHFLIEGYDVNGNQIPAARDMIALFIHNKPLGFGIGSVGFAGTVEKIPCGLYRLTDSQMKIPLNLSIKANDPYGFVDNYKLSMGKCPAPNIEVEVISPSSISGDKTGTIDSGNNPSNTDPTCPGYRGTIDKFGTNDFVNIQLKPSDDEDGWMRTGEQFVVISGALTAAKRVTNGYNSGLETSRYKRHYSFYIERKTS
ncbi:hypothetical protein [uncultured Tenacibaculum sp.]|uniref:hypothetical protein n=1 Tax=uncultured Tenacibaculum sp. TaxID=174713 RepID=UPI00261BCC26|nr:hypothetical protein [uncultured Tenacibaculum sp.]